MRGVGKLDPEILWVVAALLACLILIYLVT